MEACAKYAEADVAYESAEQQAEIDYHAAMKKAWPGVDDTAHITRETTMDEARTVLTQTYLAVYAEGGGMQSDVWDVMVKLLNHQRQLCTEHYGL